MCYRNCEPVKGMRFIPEEVAELMLAIAHGPEFRRPVCIQLSATHAAGSAVAGLAARAMRANISFLEDQVNTCCGEVLREGHFTIEKIEEHLDMLCRLNSLIFFITADRADFPGDKQNILTKTFSELPQRILKDYNEGILELRYVLEEKILAEMVKLCVQVDEDGERDWQEEIRSLLHDKVAPRLWSIYRKLGHLKQNVDSAVEAIRVDWESDISQIWTDEGYKPDSC